MFEVSFLEKIQEVKVDKASTLLIADQKVWNKWKSIARFQKWSRDFGAIYLVKAGEDLKDIRHFPKHLTAISKQCDSLERPIQILALGGGSVGDFAGFVASIFQRGVAWAQIPTTWLAALDSSHGGKTGLNVGGHKNQVGSFHQAQKIFIVQELLESLPALETQAARGELAKSALLCPPLWKSIVSVDPLDISTLLFENIHTAIEFKYAVVKQDPFEKDGYRRILNLGHTMGHVFEMGYKIPHGEAIAQGLLFAVRLSHNLGLMKERDAIKTISLLSSHFHILPSKQIWFNSKPLTKAFVLSSLAADKKRLPQSKIDFICLEKPGKIQRMEIPLKVLVQKAVELGVCR